MKLKTVDCLLCEAVEETGAFCGGVRWIEGDKREREADGVETTDVLQREGFIE